MQQRNVALQTILFFVTCGLYGVLWYFQLARDIGMLRGDDQPSPWMDLLLTLVTCGLWGLYVAYQWPTLLNGALRERGVSVDDNLPAISLVLSFTGFHWVALILMTSAVNRAVEQPVSSLGSV
ncbi:MAG: DUF4234 domain-containing protein [Myxococcales bacterium]|nr:DUF4234 domain-containing protein [Myxococcales bacterium]